MFETVAPEAFQPRSRRLMYETLPLSIAIHAIGIGAAIAATLWTVAFPQESPRVSVAYSLTQVPDPPPPLPPPKAAEPRVEPAKPTPPPPVPVKLSEIVAPTVIPDLIPEVVPPPEPVPIVPATDTAPAGDPNGSTDGVLGEIAGRVHGIKGGVVFAEDGKLHVDRDEKLPLESVEQEYPSYPSEGQKKRLEDHVIVRYTIGTNGRVKEVEIIDHAKEKMFDDAAVEAIRRWRFRPYKKDGKAIEVVHELAVNFEIVVR